MTKAELLAKRNRAIMAAREINERIERSGAVASAEDVEQLERANAEVIALDRELSARGAADAMDARANEATSTPVTRLGDAPAEGLVRGIETPEYAAAHEQYCRVGANEMTMEQRAVLQVGLSTQGGYLASRQMATGILQAADDVSIVRRLATVISVEEAVSLGVVSLDTDLDDADWTGENTEVTEEDEVALGGRELHPHRLPKAVQMSNRLLRLVPKVGGLIQQRIGYKLGLTQEKAHLTGNGQGKPLGLFTASALGISTSRDISTGNTTTAITMDGLKRAKGNQKGAYRRNARWLFHRDLVTDITLLREGSGTGPYLWQPSTQVGEPDILLGHPVELSEYAPNTKTAGLYVGMFGDFSYYWIADAQQMVIERDSGSKGQLAKGQTYFYAEIWSDGMPVLEQAFTRIQLAAG